MPYFLIEFARPFFDEYGDDTLLVAEKIIAFSVTSWNMAIASPSKRLALINSVLRTVPASERLTAERLLLLMEKRKRKHFNDINRFIINYRIKETTDSFNVFVASTPSEDQIAEIVKTEKNN